MMIFIITSIECIERMIMMKIKIGNLIITEYCSDNKRKYHFIKEISEDPLINRFLSDNMDEWLKDSEGVDQLSIGSAYIIAEDIKLIGIIKLAFLENNGTLNLHYGVHPSYRKQHYGTRILQEVPKYIFKEMSEVKSIELYINEINKGSIHCAKNANFVYEREFQLRRDECKMKVYVIKNSK